MFDMHQPTFTVTETAKILGVDRSTIYRMIRGNKLDTGLSKPIRIKQTALQVYALDKAPLAHLLWKDPSKTIGANRI
jgi:excisionase family DNA binding protein|tara:strand:- start:578 stop:808 length:231 start_codon:yes stop_codon:yes gene_type:complete